MGRRFSFQHLDPRCNLNPLRSRLPSETRRLTRTTSGLPCWNSYASVTGKADLSLDPDGDIEIRYGTGIVFVRVFGDPPVVPVSSPILGKLPRRGVLEALNDLNMRSTFIKWLLVGDTVIAAIELFGRPFVPEWAPALALCLVKRPMRWTTFYKSVLAARRSLVTTCRQKRPLAEVAGATRRGHRSEAGRRAPGPRTRQSRLGRKSSMSRPATCRPTGRSPTP